MTTFRSSTFQVGDYLVDPARGLVTGKGSAVHLEPKVMDVLCLLAERRGRVVSRSELIDSIWKVRFGADESLSRAISILRKSFGGYPCIETIPKRGYRLTAPVTDNADPETAPALQKVALPNGHGKVRAVRPWRRRLVASAALAGLSIAIVGFLAWHGETGPDAGWVDIGAFSADGAQARRFGYRLASALQRALAACGVRVSPPRPAMPAMAGPGAVRDGELLLDGSVEHHAGAYIVAVHVDHREDQVRLWSARFRRSVEEVPALRAEVADKVADVLRCGLARRAPYGEMTTDVFAVLLELCSVMGDHDMEGIGDRAAAGPCPGLPAGGPGRTRRSGTFAR